MLIHFLVERTLHRIDVDLQSHTPIRSIIYERDLKKHLGIWKFLRFPIMAEMERRNWVARQGTANSESGAVWQRRYP